MFVYNFQKYFNMQSCLMAQNERIVIVVGLSSHGNNKCIIYSTTISWWISKYDNNSCWMCFLAGGNKQFNKQLDKAAKLYFYV